jgi:hypothetical protein
MVVAWRKFGHVLRKRVFKNTDPFVPHKILRQNPDPEYNKEVRRPKETVIRVYDKRK